MQKILDAVYECLDDEGSFYFERLFDDFKFCEKNNDSILIFFSNQTWKICIENDRNETAKTLNTASAIT